MQQIRVKKKPPYLLNICRLPQVLFTLFTEYLMWGGGNFSRFPLPFPIFDLVHLPAAHLIILIQMSSWFLNSFYPVSGLLIKRTTVTRKARYLLVPVHNFLCMCTFLYLNIAQNIWVFLASGVLLEALFLHSWYFTVFSLQHSLSHLNGHPSKC